MLMYHHQYHVRYPHRRRFGQLPFPVAVLLVLLGLPAATSATFFSLPDLADLSEGAAKLRSLLQQASGSLSTAFEAVSRAEKFLDSALDEECPAECERDGYVAVPREGHVPDSNGCGSLDVYFDDSPESWLRLEPGFSKCCHEHDLCYDTCNEDKDLCDLKFKKCLYAVCRTLQNEETPKARRTLLDQQACKAKAKLAYMAVMAVGCQLYRDAQKQACICIRPKTRNEL